MNNSTDLLGILSSFALVLGAIAGIITSSIVIARRLPVLLKLVKDSVLYRSLLNGIIYLLYFSSLAIPNGLLVWFMVFQVGKNARQLLNPAVFFSVIVQITMLVSVYSFVWGVWLAPLLHKSYQKQEKQP
jgi:hypothetical protein